MRVKNVPFDLPEGLEDLYYTNRPAAEKIFKDLSTRYVKIAEALKPGEPHPMEYDPESYRQARAEFNQDSRQKENFKNALQEVFPPEQPQIDTNMKHWLHASGAVSKNKADQKKGKEELSRNKMADALEKQAAKCERSNPSRARELRDMAMAQREFNEPGYSEKYSTDIEIENKQLEAARALLKEVAGKPDDPRVKANPGLYDSLIMSVNHDDGTKKHPVYCLGRRPDGKLIVEKIDIGDESPAMFSQSADGPQKLEYHFRALNPEPDPNAAEKTLAPDDRWGGSQKAYEEWRKTGKMPPEPEPEEPAFSQEEWEKSLQPFDQGG